MKPTLEIVDNIRGVTTTVELDTSETIVGRADATAEVAQSGGGSPSLGHIWLKSNLISRRQLLIRTGDRVVTVIKLGRAATTVNEQPIAHGEPHTLNPGDRLQFAEGEFDIVLRDPHQPVKGAAEGSADSADEIESEVHRALLKRLDLQRGDTGGDSEERRREIMAMLEVMVNERIAAIGDVVVREMARGTLQRQLTLRVTAAGGSRSSSWVDDALRHASQAFHSDLEVLIAELASRLGLSRDPRAMQQDCERIERDFAAAFGAVAAERRLVLWRRIVAQQAVRNVLNLMFGLGPLQDLMDMDSISEVMVLSDRKVFVEKFGIVERAPVSFVSAESLIAIIERIVSSIGRRIDKSSPMVDAHLTDGSRVNAVIAPVALSGPTLTIRKFSRRAYGIADLIRQGSLDENAARFLRGCVVGKKNMVVSGGTGSGKTTLLNCLSAFIPAKERIVTIEDTAELRLQQDHVVTLETRPPNVEGKGEITIRDLVKNSLRMRPDRIVVGECRGAEAIDMLQAMNTGHAGSMTTAHANSPAELVQRLEVMVLSGTDMPVNAIRQQIAAAVDVIVQLNRMNDGSRRVTAIAEVVGVDPRGGNVIVEPVFLTRWSATERAWLTLHTGYVPEFAGELIDRGILDPQVFA